MVDKILHIVDLDVPFPPTYGAAIDMYHRLISLKKAGVSIILHCFEYGRGEASILNDYCEKVYYYPRKSILEFPFRVEPYILFSRRNKLLFDRLFDDDYPVLLEGEHTCSPLMDERYTQKPFYVRMHNVEYEYYEYLAKSAKNPFKGYYYEEESKRLKKFEKNLIRAQCLFSVSERDHATLLARFPRVEYVPPFIINDTVDCLPGRGEYALYHGNLSVDENRVAAEFLINEVFPGLNVSLVIAGTKASSLASIIKNPNIRFVDSPTAAELYDLLRHAHINALPTFQPTGIKHKLINSLFSGRHCVVNEQMVEDNGLATFCHVANDAAEMKTLITQLFEQDFTEEEIEKRKNILQNIYSNQKNAEKLISVIF